MPEEWPIAGAPADRSVAPARHAGRDRLSTVRRDFFLNPDERLTEQERALMTAMLHCLAADVADELRAALPAGALVANDPGNAALIARLGGAGLLDDEGLIALLLRRADEEHIATAARARAGQGPSRVLQGLVSQDDGPLAAAAMALILARGRRRDRFGQCLVQFDDLPEDTADWLVRAVAAGLRPFVAPVDEPPDAQLGRAAEALLDRHDSDASIDSVTAQLVDLLNESGQLDDVLIVAAAEDGEMAFVAEALALRGEIDGWIAFDELLSGDERRVMLLLRAVGASRTLAALLLAGAGDLLGLADAGAAISLFDSLDEREVQAARVRFTLDPDYRQALEALAAYDG